MSITPDMVEQWVGQTWDSHPLISHYKQREHRLCQLAATYGAEQMRERAAKVCIDSWGDSGADWQSACAYLNRAIRALEIT